uniref:gamma-glutamylcyclotransferase n=1 Tax=Eutreptiella gymnastica TaxID=73025 RepID=A0A7S1J3A5_9EUGL
MQQMILEGLAAMRRPAARKPTYIFSYGANMSTERVRQRDMVALDCVNTTLEGYRLTFNHRGGYANVVACDLPGACVHGVALLLSPGDVARLKRAEYGYKLVDCVMTPYKGSGPSSPVDGNVGPDPDAEADGVLHGKVFVATNLSEAPPGMLENRPSTRYMTLLRVGVREHELDPKYVQWLEAVARIYRLGQNVEPPPFITDGPPLEAQFENFPWLEGSLD